MKEEVMREGFKHNAVSVCDDPTLHFYLDSQTYFIFHFQFPHRSSSWHSQCGC